MIICPIFWEILSKWEKSVKPAIFGPIYWAFSSDSRAYILVDSINGHISHLLADLENKLLNRFREIGRQNCQFFVKNGRCFEKKNAKWKTKKKITHSWIIFLVFLCGISEIRLSEKNDKNVDEGRRRTQRHANRYHLFYMYVLFQCHLYTRGSMSPEN